MSAPITRRGLVGCAVAAAAGAGLAAASVGLPSPAEADPLVALGVEHDRVRAACIAAEAERDRTEAALPSDCRGYPAVEIGRAIDPATGQRCPIRASSAGGIRKYLEIERETSALFGGEAVARKIDERYALLLADLDIAKARFKAAHDATGIPALNARLSALWNRNDALEERIVGAVATSPAGVAAQLRVLAHYIEMDEYTGVVLNAALASLSAMQSTRERG